MGQSSRAHTHATSDAPIDAGPIEPNALHAGGVDIPPGREQGQSDPRLDPSQAFVISHLDFVWRLLRRLGVPAAEVDDATQQVLIIALKRHADIAEGCERSFLYGTTVRVAASFRRSAFRHKRKLVGWQLEAPPSIAVLDEEIERREALALLDQALSGLTDDLRRVFVLCEIEELPAREVALLENIPAGTVASRLRRAREMFAINLRELCSAEPKP
jgi:RNA polymerase sigma-70 factor (ECF subfamily)